MDTADFDYDLPTELIAQAPAPQRDQSRLLVLDRPSGQVTHRQFRDLPEYFQEGDVLIFNDTRVIPARLRGTKADTGGQIEVLLIEENQVNDWWAMLRPAKRVKVGARILFPGAPDPTVGVEATVIAKGGEGHCRLQFSGTSRLTEHLEALGEVPLPPYITRPPNTRSVNDRERYQTVYARAPGSAAAPTAGLHFTAALLDQFRRTGIKLCFLTLHIGPGTFAPVKARTLAEHPMHEERFELGEEAAGTINAARRAGRRVVAVGTTTVRVLETVAAQHEGGLAAAHGRTRLFIYPPYLFKTVDGLLTNFHLPQSTLLMLVCAFAAPGATTGRDLILSTYRQAREQRYRFFSYGDAMLLV